MLQLVKLGGPIRGRGRIVLAALIDGVWEIARKRAIWTVALRERAHMILRLYALHGDEAAAAVTAATGGYTIRVVWPPILPSDRTELVQQ